MITPLVLSSKFSIWVKPGGKTKYGASLVFVTFIVKLSVVVVAE